MEREMLLNAWYLQVIQRDFIMLPVQVIAVH